MSKIGRRPITIPSGVTVELQDNEIVVRGTKGELRQEMPQLTAFTVSEGELLVTRQNDSRQAKANHGLARSLISNMVTGVADGFTKRLELIGTGYRVAMKGAGLSLTVGYSHPVEVAA